MQSSSEVVPSHSTPTLLAQSGSSGSVAASPRVSPSLTRYRTTVAPEGRRTVTHRGATSAARV
eukprot:673256-Prorocentrum_minimum.AAC.1